MRRVLLLDNDCEFRRALAAALEADADAEVVGEAATIREALEDVGRLRPDVVVTAYYLPDGRGVDATRQLNGAGAGVTVVVLAKPHRSRYARREPDDAPLEVDVSELRQVIFELSGAA